MKRIAIYLLALALLFTLGCAKEQKTEPAFDVVEPGGSEAAPENTPAQAGISGEKAGLSAKVSVSATVAYVFECAQGMTLYGAAEYQNTGDTPIILSSAEFRFSAGGSKVTHTFTPMLNEYDVVMPGESSYAVLWLPLEKDAEGFSEGSEVSLDVTLTGVTTSAKRRALEVDKLYLVQNYPGFATLTGSVRNPFFAECSMNMIYTGFYDESGRLLGVWYLTKNALLEQGEEKRFVTHLKELPIEELAQNTARIKAMAFAFMLSA